jgi:coenzyme F420 hydrogenase subunit beta
MKGTKMNVTDIITKQDYCIGCGICAAVCPKDNLLMSWSEQGELVPTSKKTCSNNCSLCLDICPFNDHEINQDDIAKDVFTNNSNLIYHSEIGYCLFSYVGYSNRKSQRVKGASGGMATWFLESLLLENIVDHVIAVGNGHTHDRMFEYKILNNSEEVEACCSSKYYPVELSKVINNVLKEKTDKKYAIIGLPCVVYGIRLAIKKMPRLRRRIKVLASITCGQLQNRFCTELLAIESGVSVNELLRMDFRRNSPQNLASDFSHVAITIDGKEGMPQPYSKLPMHLWTYKYFTQNACNFCDDIFGESADISFMDAWLPEYIKDYRGHSLVVTRTNLANSLLRKGIDEGTCHLQRIPIDKVAASQKGVIYKKRQLLAGRLYRTEKFGLWHPQKRVQPDPSIYKKNKRFFELTASIQAKSKKIWPKYRLSQTTSGFWREMGPLEKQIIKHERIKLVNNYMSLIFKAVTQPRKTITKLIGRDK